MPQAAFTNQVRQDLFGNIFIVCTPLLGSFSENQKQYQHQDTFCRIPPIYLGEGKGVPKIPFPTVNLIREGFYTPNVYAFALLWSAHPQLSPSLFSLALSHAHVHTCTHAHMHTHTNWSSWQHVWLFLPHLT